MNKLAVFAFALLMLFGSVLWLLADASLNQYLQSQAVLQGKYYTKQLVTLDKTEYFPETGRGYFKQLILKNEDSFSQKNLLVVSDATFSMARTVEGDTFIKVSRINIDTLTINIEDVKQEIKNNQSGVIVINNIRKLETSVLNQLADDYPELYPDISAKKYALNNPELNADDYIESHPQSISEADKNQRALPKAKKKKKRGKQYTKIIAPAIHINTLKLNYFVEGKLIQSTSTKNIKTYTIGGNTGIETNQLGGEVLISLLELVP